MLEGFTNILVIMDCLTKQVVFIPTHNTINVPALAELFVKHIFSKYGIPSYVIFDWSPEFVSIFFKSLAKSVSIKFYFTSGYYLEANGQIEKTNQALEQYLCIYYNYQQSNWVHLLSLAKFAFNNAPLAFTGIFLFFANKCYGITLEL